MKEILKSLYSCTLKRLLRVLGLERDFSFALTLAYAYACDFKRYYSWSKTREVRLSQTRLTGEIYEVAHALEKGLALRETRVGFGHEKVGYLISLITSYAKSGYKPDVTIAMALEVLEEYIAFNKQHNHQFSTEEEAILQIKNCKFSAMVTKDREQKNNKEYEHACIKFGGTKMLSKNAVLEDIKGEFPTLLKARHSVRMFSEESVDKQKIESAIRLAQYTPSSCNRQAWRVRTYSDKHEIARILEIQKGARGFIEEVPCLMLITVELQFWDSVNERYQAYVDGGMFAMTLVHALTYEGLATCCLNLSLEPKRDRSLRHLTKVPPSEIFIMIIAAGNYVDTFSVTVSHRRSINELMIIADLTR